MAEADDGGGVAASGMATDQRRKSELRLSPVHAKPSLSAMHQEAKLERDGPNTYFLLVVAKSVWRALLMFSL